jgi:hypothetical protein
VLEPARQRTDRKWPYDTIDVVVSFRNNRKCYIFIHSMWHNTKFFREEQFLRHLWKTPIGAGEKYRNNWKRYSSQNKSRVHLQLRSLTSISCRPRPPACISFRRTSRSRLQYFAFARCVCPVPSRFLCPSLFSGGITGRYVPTKIFLLHASVYSWVSTRELLLTLAYFCEGSDVSLGLSFC